MSLPKLAQPVFIERIPSTGKEFTFRPYVTKEEKVLLMAQASKTDGEMVEALKAVIEACCPSLVGYSLTLFDIEYLFLKLTARSVNNIVQISFKDTEDEKTRTFDVDLEGIIVKFNPKNESLKKIRITDRIGMVMKYPPAGLATQVEHAASNPGTTLVTVVAGCIENIWDGDSVFPTTDCDPEELKSFVESIPLPIMQSVKEYFETLPKLEYIVTYVNDKGTQRSITLSRLSDFFTLRFPGAR
jgi:T4 bacteriophage base plate protein